MRYTVMLSRVKFETQGREYKLDYERLEPEKKPLASPHFVHHCEHQYHATVNFSVQNQQRHFQSDCVMVHDCRFPPYQLLPMPK